MNRAFSWNPRIKIENFAPTLTLKKLIVLRNVNRKRRQVIKPMENTDRSFRPLFVYIDAPQGLFLESRWKYFLPSRDGLKEKYKCLSFLDILPWKNTAIDSFGSRAHWCSNIFTKKNHRSDWEINKRRKTINKMTKIIFFCFPQIFI